MSIRENLKQFLIRKSGELSDYSTSPRLDAELLICDVLKWERAYLYAHLDKILTHTEMVAMDNLLDRRKAGEPIAYILGRQAFWDFDLKIKPGILIPRPETESLVEKTLELLTEKGLHVVDLGTGSGAIALALAKERPNWHLYATDISPLCLEVAKGNAEDLQITNIDFLHGAWCKALPNRKFDGIVANPPYIAQDDVHLEKNVAQFEPENALIADEKGLKDLRTIIEMAQNYLHAGAYLILEHGYTQADIVQELMRQQGYIEVGSVKDYADHWRITYGKFKAS